MLDLVTGGAGFIGSHLTDRLLSLGRSVRVVDNTEVGKPRNLVQHKDNPKLEVMAADVADPAAMAKAMEGVERVFHLAALADIVPSIVNPEGYFRSNVVGTFVTLQAARAANIKRFVYVASSSCYGIPDSYPTPETSEIRPQYPYALTKWLGECEVMHWAQVYGLPALSLRFFNIYGPRARAPAGPTAPCSVSSWPSFLPASRSPSSATASRRATSPMCRDAVDALICAAEIEQGRVVPQCGQRQPGLGQLSRPSSSRRPRRCIFPSGRAEPDCTFADTAGSRPNSAGRRKCRLRMACKTC